MSRAGYADFFPTAPSVLAKKAQAAKAAKEKRRIQQHDEYCRDRDISGALSAGSTASSTTSVPTTTQSNSQLTPATSSSSPPDGSPRPATTSPNAEVSTTEKGKKALPPPIEQPRPAIPTPKATPPAPQRRNCRAGYDPFLDKNPAAKKSGKVTYRYDGEGVRLCISLFIFSPAPLAVLRDDIDLRVLQSGSVLTPLRSYPCPYKTPGNSMPAILLDPDTARDNCALRWAE